MKVTMKGYLIPLGLVLLITVPVCADTVWHADQRLTNNPGWSYLSYNNGRCLASSGDSVHVVWGDSRGGSTEVYSRHSSDRGISWSGESGVSDDPATSDYPAVASAGAAVHSVWRDIRDGNHEIYYRRSDDGGSSWASTVRLSNDPGESGFPSVAASASVVHVVWQDDRDGNSEVYYRRSADGGSTWNIPVRLTNDPGVSDFPSIEADGSNVFLVWGDNRDGNHEIYFKRSSDSGVSWGSDVRLSVNSGNSSHPSVAVEGNVLHLTWMDLSGASSFQIHYMKSTDGGLNWSADTLLTDSPRNSYNPSVASSAEEIHVTWHDLRDSVYEIYHARSADGGATWGVDANLSNNAASSYSPFTAMTGSVVQIIWHDNRYGATNHEIFLKRGECGLRHGIVAGPGTVQENPPLVRVFPPVQDASHFGEFTAYGAPSFGVNVACGRVGGGPDHAILTGPGPGAIYGPHVRGFTSDGSPLPGLSFLAYGTRKYGVNVTAGDLDGDGYDEIITGAGPGRVFGPHVRAFDYDGGPGISPVPGVSYFAYGTHKYGVNVAAGDIDGDGYDEIVTGAGPGAVFGPHVRGWNVDGGPAEADRSVSYFAYGTLRWGVRVACGDLDGDGMDEIVTAPGPSALFGAHVRGWNYDGDAITPLPGFSFFAWPPSAARYGARVFAGTNLDATNADELVVGAGPDPAVGSPVKVFSYDGEAVSEVLSLEAFPASWSHGSVTAAGWF